MSVSIMVSNSPLPPPLFPSPPSSLSHIPYADDYDDDDDDDNNNNNNNNNNIY